MKWKNKPTCNMCGHETENPDLWCEKCGNLNFIKPIKFTEIIKRSYEYMWNLQSILPKFEHIITQFEGNTPILKIQNIEDLKEINLKLEYRNPTGSFRDRASSLIISDTISKNKNLIVNPTTGSFGISLASYGARVGVNIVNVIPKNIDSSKIEQMKIYNSEVIIDGDYIDSAIGEAKIISNNTLISLIFSFFLAFLDQK